MKLLEKILVPIDVNTDSKEQISGAIKLAKAYKSEIILISVVPDLELKEEIKNIVEKFVAESLNGIKEIFISNNIEVQEPLILFGNIVETIVQQAYALKVNLVLIGAKEKKKRDKYKLGVTSQQIIRASEVPVCLIDDNKKSMLSHILCPVDFSEPSKRALYNAILLARKFNSSLSILNVYEPLTYVSERINIDLEEENALRLKRVNNEMEAFIKEFDLNEIDHQIEIIWGKADEEILNRIESKNIDLLIMGTNGRTGLSRFFMGSITEKVIREMPCSFITMKRMDLI